MSDNKQIATIVEIYLAVSSTPEEDREQLAKTALETLHRTFKQFIPTANSPIILPYKDIADVIFRSSISEISSDTITNFQQKIDDLIREIPDKTKQKTHQHRLLNYHKKFVGQILLARAQKEFIQKSVKSAQKIVDKAETEARKAEKTASQAQLTAKKAEQTYKSMFANYVTILGIFTAIIVTIFGGLNVINAVIEINYQTSLALIVFIVALVMFCLIVLLYFLATMIGHISQQETLPIRQQYKVWFNWVFLAIIGVCILLMIISLPLKPYLKNRAFRGCSEGRILIAQPNQFWFSCPSRRS